MLIDTCFSLETWLVSCWYTYRNMTEDHGFGLVRVSYVCLPGCTHFRTSKTQRQTGDFASHNKKSHHRQVPKLRQHAYTHHITPSPSSVCGSHLGSGMFHELCRDCKRRNSFSLWLPMVLSRPLSNANLSKHWSCQHLCWSAATN